MSLGDRLRDMFDTGAGSGASGPGGPGRRRSRTQAQPVNPVRSYDGGEPPRQMPRAQWIGLGLAAALAVALTAGLVFVILTIMRGGDTARVATPTPLPVTVAAPTVQSVADIFASPGVTTPVNPAGSTAPTPTVQVVGQRLQVGNTGGDGANLRRDAGQSGEKVKTLPEGTSVDVVGPDRIIEGQVWRNVRDIQGDSGWIVSSFLVAEGSVPAPAIVAAPPASTGGTPSTSAAGPTAVPKPTSPGVASGSASRGQVGNTGGQGANIRSEPGGGGRVLKTVPDGTNLEVLGQDREVDGQVWRQVRDPASGVTGWIIRGAVAPAGTVPTPGPAAAPKPTAAAPAAGATAAPGAPKPTAAPGAAPAATAVPKPANTPVPGSLPIIIQPATPRPQTGGSPVPKP